MFILRRITSENIEINTCLVIDYVLISREKNLEEFKKTTELWTEEDSKEVYGLVTYDEGESIMPLYKKSQYYVMIGDGKTFSNITDK
jgi:hypothetical protein